MIKQYYYYKGYFYLILQVDDQVRFAECPAYWFDQEDVGDQIKVKLTWPPPKKPTTDIGTVDKMTAVDEIVVVKG